MKCCFIVSSAALYSFLSCIVFNLSFHFIPKREMSYLLPAWLCFPMYLVGKLQNQTLLQHSYRERAASKVKTRHKWERKKCKETPGGGWFLPPEIASLESEATSDKSWELPTTLCGYVAVWVCGFPQHCVGMLKGTFFYSKHLHI